MVDGQAEARINEEVATTFAWTDRGEVPIGLFVLTMGDGESVVMVDRIRVWEESP